MTDEQLDALIKKSSDGCILEPCEKNHPNDRAWSVDEGATETLIENLTDAITHLRAALAASEAARAETAAGAYEAAALALDHVAKNRDCGHNESRLCDCGPYVEQWALAADEVRALTPADAIAALEARDKRVREEARKVKPLVWEGDAETRLRADVYSVRPTYGQGPSKYVLARAGNVIGWFADPEPAKAAAQADYEARILSALIGGDA